MTILDDVHAVLTKYVAFPSPEAAYAVSAYVVVTHMQPMLDHAPRLAPWSPVKGCGKTTLLDVLRWLVHKPVPSSSPSPAFLARSGSKDDPPTFLLDEMDRAFGHRFPSERTHELVRILNNGFSKGGTYDRVNKDSMRPESFPIFAMAVLASKGQDLPDTVLDRAVVVPMQRPRPDQRVVKFRERNAKPELDAVRERIEKWVERTFPEREILAWPRGVNMPLNGRAADVWEALILVGRRNNKEWEERVKRAAVKLTREAAEDDDDEPLHLLADLRNIFNDLDEPWVRSETLVEELHRISDAPWGEWPKLTTHRLARLLRAFGIRPAHNRDKTARGYRRADLEEMWETYIPAKRPERPKRPARGSKRSVRAKKRRDASDGSDAFPRGVPTARVGKKAERIMPGETVRTGRKPK